MAPKGGRIWVDKNVCLKFQSFSPKKLMFFKFRLDYIIRNRLDIKGTMKNVLKEIHGGGKKDGKW